MDLKFLEYKTIFITGITGTLGNKLTERIFNEGIEGVNIIGYSRDEKKQFDMKRKYANWDGFTLFQGDVRDRQRLRQVMTLNIDIIINAAALKMVPECELYPYETVKTNIIGTQNIIDIALEKKVPYVLGVGTDKDVHPYNVYGMSKGIQEKLLIAANFSPQNAATTKFSTVRYGNVMNSRGSVIPIFLEQIRNGEKLTITDPAMTRFLLTQDDACDLIFLALKQNGAGSTYIMKPPACTMEDLARAMWVKEVGSEPNKGFYKVIGIRPGEKMHEELISEEEMRVGYDFDDKYFCVTADGGEMKSGQMVPYTSENAQRLSVTEIIHLLEAM